MKESCKFKLFLETNFKLNYAQLRPKSMAIKLPLTFCGNRFYQNVCFANTSNINLMVKESLFFLPFQPTSIAPIAFNGDYSKNTTFRSFYNNTINYNTQKMF